MCCLRDERADVIGFDAAAVQNPRLLEPGNRGANRAHDRVGVRPGCRRCRCRSPKSVRRPPRSARRRPRRTPANAAWICAMTRFAGSPASCSSVGLADRDDRRDAVRKAAGIFLIDRGVGLAVVRAPFRMPQNHPARAAGDEHRRGDLTGESAVVGVSASFARRVRSPAASSATRDVVAARRTADRSRHRRRSRSGASAAQLVHERGSPRRAILFIFQLPTTSVFMRTDRLLERGNAGQRFAFEKFERCAAAGRDVRHRAGEAQRVRGRRRVAAADDAGRAGARCCRRSLRRRYACRCAYGGLFVDAHRAVEDDRLRPRSAARVRVGGLRVRCRGSSGRRCSPSADDRRRRVGVERIGDDGVDRQVQVMPCVLAFGDDAWSPGPRSGSRSDLPTSTPCAARNVLAMPPPMTKASTRLSRLVEHADLVGDLRAADRADERLDRIVGEPRRARPVRLP